MRKKYFSGKKASPQQKTIVALNTGPSLTDEEDKNRFIFQEKAEQYGLKDLVYHHISVTDLDGDGFSDLTLLHKDFTHPRFYRYHKETGKFTSYAKDPFSQTLTASYILFFDMNHNQKLDAFVGEFHLNKSLGHRPLKYYQASKEDQHDWIFPDYTEITDRDSLTSSIFFFQRKSENSIDVFLGNWLKVKENQLIPDNDLYLQYVDNSLADKTKKYFPTESELTRGEAESQRLGAVASWSLAGCDLNNDGVTDIMVSAGLGYQNKLWISQPDGTYVDFGGRSEFGQDHIGQLKTTGGGRTQFSLCADFNDNGFFDIFLGELTEPLDNDEKDQSSFLFQKVTDTAVHEAQEIVRFSRQPISSLPNASLRSDRRGYAVDLTMNGYTDLLIESRDYPPHTRFNVIDTMTLQDVAPTLGIDIMNPLSVVVVDFNDDGKPDLLMSQSNKRNSSIKPQVYYFENQAKPAGIHYKLLFTNNHSLYQLENFKAQLNFEHIDKSTTRSVPYWIQYTVGHQPVQHERAFFVTARKNERLKSIEVTWPGGHKKIYHIPHHKRAQKIYIDKSGHKKLQNFRS